MHKKVQNRISTIAVIVLTSVLASSCGLLTPSKDLTNTFRTVALSTCDAEAVSGSELEELFSYWDITRQSEIDTLCEYEMANANALYHDDIAKTAACFPDFDSFFESRPQGLFAEYDSDDRLNSHRFFDVELNDYDNLDVLVYFDYDVSSISDFEETIVMVYELDSTESAYEDFQYYIDCIEDLYYLDSDDFNIKEYEVNDKDGFFISHFEGDYLSESTIGLMGFDEDDFHCDEAVYWQDNYIISVRSVGFSDSVETAVIEGLELESPVRVQNSRSVQESYSGVADIMLIRLYKEYLLDHMTYIDPAYTTVVIEEEEGHPVTIDSIRDGGTTYPVSTVVPEQTPIPTPTPLPQLNAGEDFTGFDFEGDGTDYPVGRFAFSDAVPYEQRWSDFFSAYGITDVTDASDPRVQIIIDYNGLDSSYSPCAGDQLLMPPIGVITGEIENDTFNIRGNG